MEKKSGGSRHPAPPRFRARFGPVLGPSRDPFWTRFGPRFRVRFGPSFFDFFKKPDEIDGNFISQWVKREFFSYNRSRVFF